LIQFKHKAFSGTGSFVPFFITRQPATSIAVQTQSTPVPLVTPFLATSWEPEFLKTQTALPVEIPEVTPTASVLRPETDGRKDPGGLGFVGPQPQPQPPTQRRHVINPSGAGMIIGLITKGISQFAGGGWDAGPSAVTDGEAGTSFLNQIPQFIRSLQPV
uniref:DUF4774 domain-containing protein n=1 Tax=Gongylonema pulchrum TaxID=637853 RepID=A0A183DE77_9BILA